MKNVACYSNIRDAIMNVVSKFTPYFYISIYGYPEKYIGSAITDKFSFSPLY